MNLILLRAEDFVAEGKAVLKDRRLAHVREVLRPQVGETLVVGIEGGAIGRGTVTALADDHVALTVAATEPPPPPLDVLLAVALPRPPTLRKVLQQATALGVKRFAFFRAERVERSYFTSHALRAEAIAEDLRLGLEQARDTLMPTVEVFPEAFSWFVRSQWAGLSAGRRVLVAHPGGEVSCPYGQVGAAALVIGPEGGFIPEEVSALAAGGETIDLGRRILRVETAVVALLARLS